MFMPMENGGGAARAHGRDASLGLAHWYQSGSANVKGSWSEIVPSTPIHARSLAIATTKAGYSGDHNLIDVGVGAAGQEKVVVSNWFGLNAANGLTLPCNIPRGSRVALRLQCNSSSAECRTVVQLFGDSFLSSGMTGSETIGMDLSISCVKIYSGFTGADYNKGSWNEIGVARKPWKALWVFVCAAAGNNQAYLMDIGVGAAGYEKVLVHEISHQDRHSFNRWYGPFRVRTPRDSRFAFRISRTGTVQVAMGLIGMF